MAFFTRVLNGNINIDSFEAACRENMRDSAPGGALDWAVIEEQFNLDAQESVDATNFDNLFNSDPPTMTLEQAFSVLRLGRDNTPGYATVADLKTKLGLS